MSQLPVNFDPQRQQPTEVTGRLKTSLHRSSYRPSGGSKTMLSVGGACCYIGSACCLAGFCIMFVMALLVMGSVADTLEETPTAIKEKGDTIMMGVLAVHSQIMLAYFSGFAALLGIGATCFDRAKT